MKVVSEYSCALPYKNLLCHEPWTNIFYDFTVHTFKGDKQIEYVPDFQNSNLTFFLIQQDKLISVHI